MSAYDDILRARDLLNQKQYEPDPYSRMQTLALNMAHAQGGAEEFSKWVKWLAEIGYGVDFTHTPPPPCTPHQLAEVYAERDGDDPEDWAGTLLDGNTAGGWYGNDRDTAP